MFCDHQNALNTFSTFEKIASLFMMWTFLPSYLVLSQKLPLCSTHKEAILVTLDMLCFVWRVSYGLHFLVSTLLPSLTKNVFCAYLYLVRIYSANCRYIYLPCIYLFAIYYAMILLISFFFIVFIYVSASSNHVH